METRQTTNLKIAGSTPARLVFFLRRVRVRERKEEEEIRGRSKGEEEHKVREQRE